MYRTIAALIAVMAMLTAQPVWSEDGESVAARILSGVLDPGFADLAEKALNEGAAAPSVPSNTRSARRLLEGAPTDGWVAAEPFDAASPPSIVVTLGPTLAIDRILVQPKNWKPGSRTPSEIEIAVSASDEAGFTHVGRWKLADQAVFQLMSFEARQARLVRLTILSVNEPGRPGIGKIAILAPDTKLVLSSGPPIPSPPKNDVLDAITRLPQPLSGSVPRPAQAAEICGSDEIKLQAAAENAAIGLALDAYCLKDEIGGQAAPEGRRFLLVKGRFASQLGTALGILPISGMLRLQLAAGVTVDADPLTDTTLSPGFGASPLQPGDTRRFEIAFAVPPESLSQAAIVHPGAAGVLVVPVIAPTIAEAEPVATAQTDQLIVSALAVNRRPSFESAAPGAGRGYVGVSLKLEAATEAPVEIALGEFVALVEDGSYVHAPLAGGDPRLLMQAVNLYPGLPVYGNLVFDVAATAADLQLVVFGSQGPASLDLTPDKAPVPLPEPVAGPVEAGSFAASLLGWKRVEGAQAPAGQAYFTADLRIALKGVGPLVTSLFDGAEAIRLTDASGTRYEPAPIWEQLAYPLRNAPLWSSQPIRGEVAFLLPAAVAASPLSLEIATDAEPIRLALPSQASMAGDPPPTKLATDQPTSAAVPRVRLESSDLKSGDPIVVLFEALTDNTKNWISIAEQGTADDKYLQYLYTNSAPSGRLQFEPRRPGSYEIRVYFNDSFQVEARLAFTVVGAQPAALGQILGLARKLLTEGNSVTVTWRGLPGDGLLALVPKQTPDYPSELRGDKVFNANGRTEGRHVFAPQPSGDYELRVYTPGSDGFELRDRLAFTVQPQGAAANTGPEPDNPAVTGLTNVASHEMGAFAQAAEGWEKLIDGNATDYDEETGTAVLSSDSQWPNQVWLARPYPIDLVRLLLCDLDQRTYRYRLQGSPDGVTWSTLTEATNARAWQDVPLAGRSFIAFRLMDFGTDAADGKFCIVEFAAYTPETLPPLPALALPATDSEPPWEGQLAKRPINIALPALGATASGGASPENLIDGDRSDPSRAEAPLGEPLTVMLDKAYALATVRFLLMTTGERTYRYRLEGSLDGDNWELLADRTQSDQSGVQEIDLPGRKAKAIRIIGTTVPPNEPFAVVEFEALASGPLPISDIASLFYAQNETADRNLALALHGGHVEQVSSHSESTDGLHLIDGTPASGWLASDASLPQEIVLSFPGRGAALIDGIDLYRGGGSQGEGYRPGLVDVAIATGEPGTPWQRVGRYALPVGCGYGCAQRIVFAPVTARALRLTVLVVQGNGPAGIGEIVVREAERDGYASLLPHRRPGFAGGINIANVALGGRVEQAAPVAEHSDTPPELVIDGLATGGGYWAPENDATTPQIVLSFTDDRTALVGGVAFLPHGGYSNFSNPRNARWTSLVDVWASEESPTSGYRWIGRYRLDQADRTQVFAFEPVRAKYLRVLLLATQRPYPFGAVLGEIEVLEATAPGYTSILASRPPNLLDFRFGGHVAVPYGKQRTDLIDSTSATPGWFADAGTVPINLTFGFYHGQPRRIDGIGFNPRTDQDPASWVQRIKVLVSDHPLRGFTPVGEFVIAQENRLQYFDIDPVEARYVQIRLLETAGSGKGVSLGDVAAREAAALGELSIVARRIHPLPEETGAGTTGPGGLVAADLQENEPNDTAAASTVLPLDKTLAGRIAPLTDVDWYAVDTTTGPTDSLSLAIEERPVLRMGLDLFDAAGQPVAMKALHDLDRDRAEMTWLLPRGRYMAKLSRPKNSIVFIVDRSDSITPVRGEIAQMAASFARQAGPDEAISFASMGGQVLNDFSSDREVLIAAARQTSEGQEGSPVYSSLMESIDRLSQRPGAKVIVIVTDGEDSSSSEEPLYKLWSMLANTGVRIYTVGYGEAVTLPLGDLLGSTGGDMLRSFSAATGGRFFHAPSGSAMLGIYSQIASDLRSESDYRIRAHVGQEGQLAVSETGERITGVSAPEQIELILDASGSMKEKMEGKKTRWDVAREVLHEVIDKLPAGTEVALRVYGHRYPSKPHKKSCTDSELVVPFASLDREHLHNVVNALRPRGETPIGLSLAQLPQDFGDKPGHKVVILVTDGEESCDPKPTDQNFPPKAVGRLIDSGFSVEVSIVGFGIEDSATRDFLSDLAVTGKGAYYDASGGAALTSALDAAFSADFAVADDAGRPVAKGKVGGEPIVLPAGSWHVSLAADPPRDLGTVKVDAGSLTRLLLAKEGDRFGQSVEVQPLAAQ